MDSYRIHKDLAFQWGILTNGEAVSLVGRDLKLILVDPKGGQTEMPFTIGGDNNNKVIFTFYGKDHKYCGNHHFTLWENYGVIGMTAVDKMDAFRLVANTNLERHE